MKNLEREVVVDPSAPLPTSALGTARLPRWVPDVLGLLWVVLAGIAVVGPALIHGLHLGPFDLLSGEGLSKQRGVAIHDLATGDQVDAIMPWTTLVWTQVHHGQLPLWNPYG